MYKGKDIPALQTIFNAREFLINNKILCTEKWFEDIEGLCSVQLSIVDTGYFVNGKGTDKQYALASAYGELLERLQNLVFFRINSRIHYENNKSRNLNKISLLYEKITDWLNKIPKLKEQSNIAKFIADKFVLESTSQITSAFNTIDGASYFEIPTEVVDLYYGTNGMASGNSREEALVQGLSEILERYVVSVILQGDLTPPDINDDFFAKHDYIKKAIDNIESSGNYKVIIKDLSLGRGLPAAGLVLVNIKEGTYFVKIAVHPHIEIAVERCLTELMQGKRIDNYIGMSRFGDNNLSKSERNRYQIFLNGEGNYPYRLFMKKPDYKSSLQSIPFDSNNIMLNYLIRLIEGLGYKIYINESTFSPLFSFHIVVPGMSEIINVSDYSFIESIIRDRRFSTLLSNLSIITANDAEFLLSYLENFNENESLSKLLKLDMKKGNFYSKVKILQFKIMLHIFLHQYTKAANLLKILNNKASNSYYRCLEYMLRLDEEKLTQDEARDILSIFFDNELINEIYDDLNQNTFSHMDYLIYCAEKKCYLCSLNKHCLYTKENELYDRIKEISVQQSTINI